MPTSTTGANDDNVIMETGKAEVERLQLQHKVLKHFMKDLILAPVQLDKPGLRILDQATADGTWLRDIRTQAEPTQHSYVGTDIVDAYFPREPPSGMSFFHQSMTEPWPADWKGTFDFVHSRLALPGAGIKPVGDVIADLAGLLKPGVGWLQLVEVDPRIPDDSGPALKRFGQVFRDLLVAVTQGAGMDLQRDCAGYTKAAGLVDVQQRVFNVAFGKAADTEEQRTDSARSLVETCTGMAMFLKSVPHENFTDEELDELPALLERELVDIGGVFPIFAVWGRRP